MEKNFKPGLVKIFVYAAVFVGVFIFALIAGHRVEAAEYVYEGSELETQFTDSSTMQQWGQTFYSDNYAYYSPFTGSDLTSITLKIKNNNAGNCTADGLRIWVNGTSSNSMPSVELPGGGTVTDITYTFPAGIGLDSIYMFIGRDQTSFTGSCASLKLLYGTSALSNWPAWAGANTKHHVTGAGGGFITPPGGSDTYPYTMLNMAINGDFTPPPPPPSAPAPVFSYDKGVLETRADSTGYERWYMDSIVENDHYEPGVPTDFNPYGDHKSDVVTSITVRLKNNNPGACTVNDWNIKFNDPWIGYQYGNSQSFTIEGNSTKDIKTSFNTTARIEDMTDIWAVPGVGGNCGENLMILYGDQVDSTNYRSTKFQFLGNPYIGLPQPAMLDIAINGDFTPPPNGKKIIRIGVILYDIAGVPHANSLIQNQPVCKINSTPSYNGHNLTYFQDLKACAQDYYNEVLPDQVDLRFTIIGGGQWYADTSGRSENDYSGDDVARLFSLVNGGIVASQTDTKDYDIIVLVHSGYSSQRHGDGQTIPPGGGNGTIGTNTIWSDDPERVNDPVGIVIAENDGFGPWAHELGHAIARSLNVNRKITPELYTSGTVKQWDVMANGYENGDYSDPPQMSSYVKHYLNLLGNDIHRVSDYGTYPINAYENLKTGDSIFRYNLTDDNTANAEDYYLLEVRDRDIGEWDKSLPGKDLVMYRVKTDGHDDLRNSLKLITLPAGGVLGANDSYQDLLRNLFINVVGSSGTGQTSSMSVSIDSLANHLVDQSYGVVMSGYNVLLQQVQSLGGLFHIADPANDLSQLTLDLHAYCPGGRHIGMNYETGQFENQVPSSIVSGSNGGAPEWIFVPTSVTSCRFFVSSERINEYFTTHPDIAVQLSSLNDTYEIFARYLDPETGIFTSSVQTDQVIQPGVMMKHEVSGTTEIAVTPGVVGTPNEPPPAPKLFCPLLAQGVTYSALPPAPACTFTNGPKSLQMKDSSCNPIAGARVNVRKANGAYLTYALTDANGLANLSGYANPDASYFEIDYHGATYSTGTGTFSSGTGVQTHPYELSLKGSDCVPITGARVNLRKTDGAYVTYALTNADGNASFEVVPNASMKLETDYQGGTWMSESRGPDTGITLGTDKYSLILTDNAGGAISAARVNLRKENGAYVTYALTNGSGAASFNVLPNVPLIFEVDYNGATYQTAVSTTHEENRTSAIPFGVHLLDSNGTPISGARVNLRKSNDAYVTYALTDANGAALFQVVPGAQMKLEVDYHGATYSTGVLDAPTSPSVTIQTKPFGLHLINSAGEPISGARVNFRKSNGSYVTYTTTNTDGNASFQVVPGAQMLLEVDYHGNTYQTAVVTVSGDTILQVQTSPITVHLTAQGLPLANTRTDLLKENGTYVTYGMTGAAGDVIFEVVPNSLNKVRAAYNGTSWVSDAIIGGSTVTKDF